MSAPLFHDRVDGGRQLVAVVDALHLADPIVLALPRGGVPVAAEVARVVGAPLDVVVARKVGAPGQPELGIGAVAEGGGTVVGEVARQMGVTAERFERLADLERAELVRRVRIYRGSRPLPDLVGREVVLVDDGLATGVTAEAALRSIRAARPSRLVLAVPTAAPDTAARLARVADDVLAVMTPEPFLAVGRWYVEFDQTSDLEVLDLLTRAESDHLGSTGPSA